MQIISISFVLLYLFVIVYADVYEVVRNSRNFTGKVVLVTGSSSGIGETTAKLFSSLGASVVITGRNQTNIKRVAEEAKKLSPHGLKPLEVIADLTKDEDIVRLINETITEYGVLDVLVNNAASGSLSSIYDANILNEFDNTFAIVSRAPLYLTHLLVPYLQKSKGTIINISGLGIQPMIGELVHCMAKASLDMMTKVLSVELGSYGIRVNTINPGYTETNSASKIMTEDILILLRQKIISLTPLKRPGEPIDVAKAIVFLASNDSHYITGSSIDVDGGQNYNFPANFFQTLLTAG